MNLDHINNRPSDPPRGWPRACLGCGSNRRDRRNKVPWSSPLWWDHEPWCPDAPPREADIDIAAARHFDICPNCNETHETPGQGRHCLAGCDCDEVDCPGSRAALVLVIPWMQGKSKDPGEFDDVHNPVPVRRGRLSDPGDLLARAREWNESEKP